jgi:AsmA protein
MSLFLKILAAVIGLLILIIGGLAIYLFTIFDPNDYKAEILALVEEQTELKLDIQGDLQLSVFPWLGVSVEKITVDTPQGALASAGYARVFAKVAPLLKGELEVDGVALRDLKLNLVKDAKGRANWQISTPSKQPKNKPGSGTEAVNLPLAAFAFGYLKVENAEISYRDLTSNASHQLQNLNFQVSNVSATSSFPVSASFGYRNPQLKSPVQAHFTSKINLNLPKEQVSLNDTVLDLDNARIQADIDIDQLLSNPVVEGIVKVLEVVPADWAALLGQDSLNNIQARFDLQSELRLDTGAGELTLNKLALSAPELQLNGDIKAQGLNSDMTYSGQLKLGKADLKTLLPKLAIDLPDSADKQVLKSLTGEVAFQGSEKQFDIPKIALQLDDSTLSGSLKINDFDTLANRFDLTIDRLNLDRYLPADTGSESPSSKSSQPTSADALLLPLALLHEINTNGRLRIGQLEASGQQISNLDASVTANNGFINLKSLTGNLYEGSIKANATIDARSNTPQISVTQTLSGIQAAPLLSALADVDYLLGKLNLNLNLSARGNSIDQIKRSLTGTADFALLDGLLKNTNIEQLVCRSVARIRDRSYIASDESPDTPFQRFDGRMNIVNGVMQSEGLQLVLKTLKVTGGGLVNLPEETLDYRIRATITGDLENESCEVHERYRNVAWPLRCQGALTDDPSQMCGLDQRELQNIAAQLAEQEIKRKASEKIEEKLQKQLGDDAAQQLKNLLGL